MISKKKVGKRFITLVDSLVAGVAGGVVAGAIVTLMIEDAHWLVILFVPLVVALPYFILVLLYHWITKKWWGE